MLPLGAPPRGLNKLKKVKPDHLLVAKRHNHDTSLLPGQTTTAQIKTNQALIWPSMQKTGRGLLTQMGAAYVMTISISLEQAFICLTPTESRA